jgi:hypothetical protein
MEFDGFETMTYFQSQLSNELNNRPERWSISPEEGLFKWSFGTFFIGGIRKYMVRLFL